MRSKKPKSVGEILAVLTKKSPLGKKLQQARIWEWWPEIAGAHLHEHGRPHSVKDGTLSIEVDSTVWMNKYAYYKWDILKRINRMAGEELVSDIFLMLTPDQDPTPPKAPPRKG